MVIGVQQPIDYSIKSPDVFDEAAKGFSLGASYRQAEQAQLAQQAQQEQQKQYAQAVMEFRSNPNPGFNDYQKLAILSPPAQVEPLLKLWGAKSKVDQDKTLLFSGQVMTAIKTGNLDVADRMLAERSEAARNSNDKAEAKGWDDAAKLIKLSPGKANEIIGLTLAHLPGGKEVIDAVAKSGEAQRAEEKAPFELSEAKSKAEIEAVKSKFSEKQQLADLQKKYADIGLTGAQTKEVIQRTSNLTIDGQTKALDFKAALTGVGADGKKIAIGKSTEDERKAAGWLSQATNAYGNMLGAMYTKEGKRTGADEPSMFDTFGGALRGEKRQKFVQAASSLSEAVLRAATGAGVTKDEALQKVQELTPSYWDTEGTRKQKLDAIPIYLQSLKDRAGRAAPEVYSVPTAPTPAKPTTAGPAIGSIQQGYRFKGGNPSDKNSWERV